MSANRRTFLTTAAALAAAPRVAFTQKPATGTAKKSRSTFVLVPGGCHGAWCWKRVTDRLRAQGHNVYPLTLTGLAERAHLVSPSVNLETHIADVINVLTWEDLHDVHLVGHSYGGMVITGVADRAANRLARVIYLDALWPKDGETVGEALGHPKGYIPSVTTPDPANPPFLPRAADFARNMGVTTPQDIAWLASKLTAQPLGTQTQPIRLKQTIVNVPVLFVACVKPAVGGVDISYQRAKERAANDPKVRTVAIQAPHDAMVTHPREVTEVLTLPV